MDPMNYNRERIMKELEQIDDEMLLFSIYRIVQSMRRRIRNNGLQN